MGERPSHDPVRYLDRLRSRLLNPDARDLITERLGREVVRWVAGAMCKSPQWLHRPLDFLGGWLTPEYLWPNGDEGYPVPLQFIEEDLDPEVVGKARRTMEHYRQTVELRNSFGIGLFVGSVAVTLTESVSEDPLGVELCLLEALKVLLEGNITPDGLEERGTGKWVHQLEDENDRIWGSMGMKRTLFPIIDRLGLRRDADAPIGRRALGRGRRAMFVAGMVAVGLEAPLEAPLEVREELARKGAGPSSEVSRGPKNGRSREDRGARMSQPTRRPVVSDLMSLSDEELKAAMIAGASPEEVSEEVNQRLRYVRLSRMLAYLRRRARKDHDGDGTAAGDD